MQILDGLFADLEFAVQEGREDKRVEVLRKVTDLFLVGADRFRAEHLDVFDDVLARLTDRVESQVLAELSKRLAPVANAPRGIIQSLANRDEIDVAGPVLTYSPRLTDADLIPIASSKGQPHLGAISGRAHLAATVTDILVARGDDAVVRKLSGNRGAAFSGAGFDALAMRARSDEQLAVNLGGRLDLPRRILEDLIARATERVRQRLMASVPPERKADLRKAIAMVSAQVHREVSAPRDFRRAESLIAEMQELGQLNDVAVARFAEAGQYEEMVVSLATLCGAKVELIEPLMQSPACDGLLLACRACDIHWTTLSAILTKRFPHRPISATDLEQARVDYQKVSTATAQRVFRFWLVRGVTQGR